jgi:hypothetical protein
MISTDDDGNERIGALMPAVVTLGAFLAMAVLKLIERSIEVVEPGESDERDTGWMSYSEFLKARTDITKAFCDTAKVYIQLSSAGLALPLLFTQAILGTGKWVQGLNATGRYSLLLAWVFFLIAILAGAYYQWFAIRGMWNDLHRSELMKETHGKLIYSGFRKTPGIPQFEKSNRSRPYGVMLISFFAGAISFAVFAINSLVRWI